MAEGIEHDSFSFSRASAVQTFGEMLRYLKRLLSPVQPHAINNVQTSIQKAYSL